MATYTAVAVLLLCCAAVSVQGRLFQADALTGRQMLQSQRCPAGCASDGCVLDSTSGGYKCTKCQNKLVVNSDDGTCGCPAGRYAPTENDCTDCPKGSWCAGGKYEAVNNPDKSDCTTDLTTIGKRSTSIKSCVNIPGTSYSVDGSGTPSATSCPVDTYGPGLRKQRACVPCPPGYTTNTATRSTTSGACKVPAGYYLKGPGQVAPCPKGEYRQFSDSVASCSKCANGVTTLNEASTSDAACVSVLPTFYPKTMTGSVVTATAKCPQKFYCEGGVPSNIFDPTNPTTLTGTTVKQCSLGTWTENIGASSADQCMTPPGFYTTTDTFACADGEYRADWKPAAAAGACTKCGDNIASAANDQITAYTITDATGASTTKVDVRASAGSCYINPGQGMYFSAATNAYRAVSCDTNNYGVANLTYGLAAFPCRDCPTGMETSKTATPSSGFYTVSSSGSGFTSPMACVTKQGFGYNGRVATQCPAGSYNAGGNYGTCTKCPVGRTTSTDPAKQATDADCYIAPGYGFHDSVIQPCPVGTYNSELRANNTAACDACPAGQTTSVPGGNSLASCDVCAAGWGGVDCGAQCGGSAATFGVAGRDKSSTQERQCAACPTMTSGFSFDWAGTAQPFTPAPVARTGAASPADCLAEFAQIVDSAWYMAGTAAMDVVSSAATFADCTAACTGDCMYVTFDYDAAAGSKCSKKMAVTGTTGDVLAFKAVPAGDTTASSKKTKGKGLASGSYTFWNSAAADVGKSADLNAATTVVACLTACDGDAECAAVAMTGATSMDATSITCKLIKGDSSVATFKRSATRAVVSKLSL